LRGGIAPTDPRNLIVFQGLKDLSVLPSIDDFGTGCAPVCLAETPVSQLSEIGRYFVGGMLTGQKTLTLVSSMPGKHRLIDCMGGSLRCAIFAFSPILSICLGCCVPCAYRFISFAELISVFLNLGWFREISHFERDFPVVLPEYN
jgi:hypothetical protein